MESMAQLPVLMALLAGMVTWGCTSLGAAVVYVGGKPFHAGRWTCFWALPLA